MRLRAGVVICALLSQLMSPLWLPAPALADGGHLLISELQVAGASSASDEFVELYNPTGAAVDLQNWRLQYHSASTTKDCGASNWTTKATIAAGTIAAHGFYLLSSTGYLTAADHQFSSGLAIDGSLQLIDGSGATIDALAWGSGACGHGPAAAVPPAGHSLERRPGADAEAGGNAYDTGDNHADFAVRATPAPQSTAAPAEDPLAGYAPLPAPDPVESAPLELNELLPDPAAPLTDAADEFVEIYNPNDTPIDLNGYVIKTGATLSTKHTLAAGVVPAAGYLALKSGTTKIALSNSGSSVALFDPDGHQLGATITYPKAKTGQAWARADDTWSWTATPTPGAPNVMQEPSVTAGSPAKPASSKASSSSKAKTSTAKATKAPKATTASAKTTSDPAAGTTPGGHWLLFALAGLTIAYVIYEFRYDIQNFYYRLRGYPGRSRAPGQTAQRGRGRRTGERSGRGQDDLRAGAGPWSWLRRRSDQPNIHTEPRV
jgi:hypothetical protein